ncbi:MAG: peptidase [Gammaproteobacteria bacterium]|nr:peptidase [Gammaproteobacteria bacterium]
MFEETRSFLEKIGLPSGDLMDLPTSEKTFNDGSQFRIEIPTVNSIEAAEALLLESEKLCITINRITETQGMFRYTKNDIRRWVALCESFKCDFIMSVGPRATYDTGASAATEQGKTVGYRLRGQEQLVRAVEDVKRGIELGVRNFLIYDEGLLWVLNKMRQQHEIPSYIEFKISAHCGHCNPASFQLLESIGANSINPVRDLHLSMIAALRQSVTISIDCHTDNPPSSGGFIRVYEASEIVRIAAPVYLKTGNSVISRHGQVVTANEGKLMAKQAAIVVEMVDRYLPSAIQSVNTANRFKVYDAIG